MTPDASLPINYLPHTPKQISFGDNGGNDEMTLVNEFNVDGANAAEVLGYNSDGNGENGRGGSNDDVDDDREGNPASIDPAVVESSEEDKENSDEDNGAKPHKRFQAFQTHVAKRAEGNCCTGGLRTQHDMVRAWEVHGIYFLEV
ncbi:hypothetical protein L208DRAFT_1376789 [Tricholoma matsutake]|nr:hypothetical protein L208DRAFT_1376789 [Tricholoma matsutake 945]